MGGYEGHGMSLKLETPATTKGEKYDPAYYHQAQFQDGKGYPLILFGLFSYRIQPHLAVPVIVCGLRTFCNSVRTSGR
jgi:hypothetical protein